MTFRNISLEVTCNCLIFELMWNNWSLFWKAGKSAHPALKLIWLQKKSTKKVYKKIGVQKKKTLQKEWCARLLVCLLGFHLHRKNRVPKKVYKRIGVSSSHLERKNMAASSLLVSLSPERNVLQVLNQSRYVPCEWRPNFYKFWYQNRVDRPRN